jgi:hypothetical protein
VQAPKTTGDYLVVGVEPENEISRDSPQARVSGSARAAGAGGQDFQG